MSLCLCYDAFNLINSYCCFWIYIYNQQMLVLWGGILPRANPTRMGDLLGSFHQGRPNTNP
ncbi:hypothetical protein HanIR_Chr02g0052271 [Helianthus annuus]|nr:hypothetical protein HanIR_Chr02g0052271 [Helianthus annuus]